MVQSRIDENEEEKVKALKGCFW